jgi:WD40 repeat protein
MLANTDHVAVLNCRMHKVQPLCWLVHGAHVGATFHCARLYMLCVYASHACCCAGLQDAESPVAMLGCAWSPCGRYIAAGSRDCNTYMWYWDLTSQTAHDPVQQNTGSANVAASVHAAVHAADWPQPAALPVLRGHSKGVWQVEFNHAGDMLASGSMDGSARVSTCGVGFSSWISMLVVVVHVQRVLQPMHASSCRPLGVKMLPAIATTPRP